MSWQGLFFDFDGTLVDSLGIKEWAFGELFKDDGPEAQRLIIDYHIKNPGMTRDKKLEYCYCKIHRRPLGGVDLVAMSNRFSELVVERIIEAPEIHGATKFLKIWSRQCPCFAVSSMPAGDLHAILLGRNMSRMFSGTGGSWQAKDEHIKAFLKEFRLDAGECIMFGDSADDCEAAQEAGVHFVGIAKPTDAVIRKYPDVSWVRNFEDLIREGL